MRFCDTWEKLHYLLVGASLSIPPTTIVIGQTPPLQVSLAIGSTGNSIQAANVVKDLSVLMDNCFSSSIHCKEAASKVRRVQQATDR